jgi:hypothetical protein
VGSLDGLLQPGEGVGPELVEQAAQRLERLGQRVEPAGALSALGQQPGPLEDAQVLADGLLGEVEVGGDVPSRKLGVLDQPQDLAPVRIGERPKDRIGSNGLLGLGPSVLPGRARPQLSRLAQ